MKISWSIMLLASVISGRLMAATALPSTTIPSHQVVKHNTGFFDYALAKINPHNADYGAAGAVVRTEVVENTIQNLYFWSDVVSLGLLSFTSITLILVLRTQDKREVIAATLISQLWNGRVIDRREIVRRTGMYNALVEKTNARLMDADPMSELHEGTESPSPRQPIKRARVQGETATLKSQFPTREISMFSAEIEQKTRLLEGQNQALRNSERNLRERLNQLSQDLEHERRRNQSLKGA